MVAKVNLGPSGRRGPASASLHELYRVRRLMYDNDYFDISMYGIAAWLGVAALVSIGISSLKDSAIRSRLLLLWTLFPAIAINVVFFALYFILPSNRYMSSPGWHWLVLLCAAAILAFIVTPPWAAAVWCSNKAAAWYRCKRKADRVATPN